MGGKVTAFLVFLGSLTVVSFAIEPIAKRRPIRVKVWRAGHRLASRKYRAAVIEDMVRHERLLIDYEWAELGQKHCKEGQ